MQELSLQPPAPLEPITLQRSPCEKGQPGLSFCGDVASRVVGSGIGSEPAGGPKLSMCWGSPEG